ncbi:MAG: hypothetical protein C0606_04560 [Hyphomicrobiales bacterium]|nr:MAG: hypothetical protein C0606_04560 [Hyphomicrobiales bacterium]
MREFLSRDDGNVIMIFALLLLPLLIAVGMGLDFARAYSVRSTLQSDLDAAVLAAAKSASSLDESGLQTKIQQWVELQPGVAAGDYELHEVSVGMNDGEISATASATVTTTLLALANIETVDVSVTSSAASGAQSHLNVYIVLDKSASMLLAATATGQQSLMNSEAGCAFACHMVEGGPFHYGGKSYDTVYELAVAMGVKLRTDVALDAVEEVLDMIDAADSGHARIRVGLYTIGQGATEVLAPTTSTSAARAALKDDSSGLTSASSEQASFFDESFDELKSMIGTAGDGSSASAPKKLVLLLTDGVHSERNWVLQTSSGFRFPVDASLLQTVLTPLNPDWCGDVKGLGAELGVLYTEYLPMPTDWGYAATLGKTMNSSKFRTVWDGTVAPSYGPKTRQQYIPVALEACASDSSLFLQANSATEIESGLAALFSEYVSQVRLSK